MKIIQRSMLAAVLFLVGCGLATLSAWAPVGLAAFDGVVSIVAVGSSAKLQADAQAVDKLFLDLASVAGTVNAGQIGADLLAINNILPTIAVDLAPLVPSKDMIYVNASFAVIETTISVYETQFAAPLPSHGPPTVVSSSCAGYQVYGDGSFHAWADCAGGEDTVDVASGPQATAANPQAGKVKMGSFKRQFNAVARKYGHSERQLPLTVAEHLRLK